MARAPSISTTALMPALSAAWEGAGNPDKCLGAATRASGSPTHFQPSV